jgi:hypothetical protein
VDSPPSGLRHRGVCSRSVIRSSNALGTRWRREFCACSIGTRCHARA